MGKNSDITYEWSEETWTLSLQKPIITLADRRRQENECWAERQMRERGEENLAQFIFYRPPPEQHLHDIHKFLKRLFDPIIKGKSADIA